MVIALKRMFFYSKKKKKKKKKKTLVFSHFVMWYLLKSPNLGIANKYQPHFFSFLMKYFYTDALLTSTAVILSFDHSFKEALALL